MSEIPPFSVRPYRDGDEHQILALFNGVFEGTPSNIRKAAPRSKRDSIPSAATVPTSPSPAQRDSLTGKRKSGTRIVAETAQH